MEEDILNHDFSGLTEVIAEKLAKPTQISEPKPKNRKNADNDPMGGWHNTIWSNGTIPGISCYIRDQILQGLDAKIGDRIQNKTIEIIAANGKVETRTLWRKWKQYE